MFFLKVVLLLGISGYAGAIPPETNLEIQRYVLRLASIMGLYSRYADAVLQHTEFSLNPGRGGFCLENSSCSISKLYLSPFNSEPDEWDSSYLDDENSHANHTPMTDSHSSTPCMTPPSWKVLPYSSLFERSRFAADELTDCRASTLINSIPFISLGRKGDYAKLLEDHLTEPEIRALVLWFYIASEYNHDEWINANLHWLSPKKWDIGRVYKALGFDNRSRSVVLSEEDRKTALDPVLIFYEGMTHYIAFLAGVEFEKHPPDYDELRRQFISDLKMELSPHMVRKL